MNNKNRNKNLNEQDLERILKKIELLEIKDGILAKIKELDKKILDETLDLDKIEEIEKEIIYLEKQISLIEMKPTLLS